jgi:transcriptional regulator with XRE-family HTH domain
MKNQAVILKRLRELKGLTVAEAASQLKCSVGWLSGIENDNSLCKIDQQRLQNILQFYEFDQQKEVIRGWLSRQLSEQGRAEQLNLDGSILRFMREKANLTLSEASKLTGKSSANLGKIENGYRPISRKHRDFLVSCYGFSPSSFNNYTSMERHGHLVPIRYRLNILVRKLSDENLNRVFGFAKTLLLQNKIGD